VLLSCWSAKGGAGTTVVVAALGVLLARTGPPGVLLVDLGGDLPAALGVPAGSAAPGSVGLVQWLAAAPDLPADAVARIAVPVASDVSLLGRGDGSLAAAPAGAGDLLASVLLAESRLVVADCGRIDVHEPATVAHTLAASATRSLLVLRPCFLALRRAVDAPLRPDGVVLLAEPGRALGPADVEDVVGAPVVARVRVTEHVARTVDAGLLAARLPRTLAQDLRGAA
jgi:hypothetical protein